MPKGERRLVPPAEAGVTGPSMPMQLASENFARRLHKVMTERGLSRSEVARLAWGTTTDKRGYTVAKNRDRISVYLKGRTIPSAKNLRVLADALGVPVEELAPDIHAATVERENPELALSVVAGRPDQTHLRVNKLVSFKTALAVAQLVNDDSPDGDDTTDTSDTE